MATDKNIQLPNNRKDKPDFLTCGLIMPISAIDGLSSDHWVEVKSIISEAVVSIEDPRFEVKLVSDADDIGVIQKRIVQNIYSSDIIICDVSGKNPNVMFELGMRLAFDKPTVIVKDDKTDYSFDTSVIEHVSYPRDLRFSKIVEFKSTLANKTISTYRKAINDPEHSTFLKSFGKFQVAALTETEVPATNLILNTLRDIQDELSSIRTRINSAKRSNEKTSSVFDFECERDVDLTRLESRLKRLKIHDDDYYKKQLGVLDRVIGIVKAVCEREGVSLLDVSSNSALLNNGPLLSKIKSELRANDMAVENDEVLKSAVSLAWASLKIAHGKDNL